MQEYFSADFAVAADRFRREAHAVGARLHQLPLRALAPDGGPLAVDIAWLGSRRPRRVLLHSTGLHGVEGFAGSAIQLKLLAENSVALPDDGALILVHVLNPYGMAWLRRVNENNVDLNRNFRDPADNGAAVSADYRALESFLNPQTPPGTDLFYLLAAWHAMRRGFGTLVRAIASGQYEYPKGLFYGGAGTEESPALLEAWVNEYLQSAESLFAIDVHTGLGRRGRQTLFLEMRGGKSQPRRLGEALGLPLVVVDTKMRGGYANRGGYACALLRWLAPRHVDVVTQEFGTLSAIRVLHAMREENRSHFHGLGDPGHESKHRLMEVFCPSSAGWRQKVLEQGVGFVARAAAYVFDAVRCAAAN